MNQLQVAALSLNQLIDPSGIRLHKPRFNGLTMVMDKGIGIHAFKDMLESASAHIDVIKLGFGTSLVVPPTIVKRKTELAKNYNVPIMPGGTLLEIAYVKGMVDPYFHMMREMGFTAIEVSDGTISLSRRERSRLLMMARELGFTVCSEYGKKLTGSRFDLMELEDTLLFDLDCGASWMTLEGREAGVGVGIYDNDGSCDYQLLAHITQHIVQQERLMWEAPRKEQQLAILKQSGVNANIGNISPEDIIALEALRRGLRSDTVLEHTTYNYEI